ncbi:MAG: pilin [Patescibacteria group bacterium]|nr:pilin [Patescibacteria group bacterium]
MKLLRFYSISLLIMLGLFMFASSGLAVCTEGTPCLTNPLKSAGIDSPQTLIGKVINSVLGIVGSLALVMFVYGGLIWMTSSGSAEQVKKGRDILIWAAIGLVVIFSAYGLVRFVIIGVGA